MLSVTENRASRFGAHGSSAGLSMADPCRSVKRRIPSLLPSPSLAIFGKPQMSPRPACLSRRALHPLFLCLLGLTLLVGCAAGGTMPQPTAGPESGPAGHYLAGLSAMRAGDYRTAATLLLRALAAEPEDIELRRQLLRLQVATGARDEAAHSARELLDLGADLAEVRLVLAVDAAASGDFVEARAHLQEIRSRGPVELAVPLLDAWALYALEGPQAAIRRIVRENASQGLAQLYDYHRGMVHALAGDIEAARRLVANAVGQAEAVPTRLVFATAYILDRAGDRERALGIVRAQLRFVPENSLLLWLEQQLLGDTPIPPPFSDPQGGMAEALTGLAQALADQNAAEQSLFFARLATFLRADDDDAWLLIARLALQRNDTEDAIAALAQVPDGSPFSWEARLLKADALVQAKRREEAIALLRRMADERPARIDALIALGDLHRRDQEYEQAEKAYAEALQRIPELTAVHWRLLYVHGITLERTGRWEEAERQFLKALEFEPDQPFVLNYLGYSWVEKGMHLDRAKEMLHRAVELRPRDGFIVDSLGWAYYQLGDYDKAVEYLERAVELEPGDPVINDHLGDAYWRVGRYREARFQWQRALSLKPEQDLVAKIEDKLRAGLPDTPPANRG